VKIFVYINYYSPIMDGGEAGVSRMRIGCIWDIGSDVVALSSTCGSMASSRKIIQV